MSRWKHPVQHRRCWLLPGWPRTAGPYYLVLLLVSTSLPFLYCSPFLILFRGSRDLNIRPDHVHLEMGTLKGGQPCAGHKDLRQLPNSEQVSVLEGGLAGGSVLAGRVALV